MTFLFIVLSSFPFLKVISETLRMANIVNGIWRKSLNDIEIKGELFTRGNSIVALLQRI